MVGRPKKEEQMEWRITLRFPDAVGDEIKKVSNDQLTPPAVLLRRWVNERLEQARRERERERERAS